MLYDTYERICLLFSLTENLLLALWTCRPSRPITINSGLITFKQSSGKRNNIDKLDTALFNKLKKLKYLWLSGDQVTYSNGKRVTQEEFEELLRNLTNKDIYIEY